MPRKEHQTTPKIIGRFLYIDLAAVPLDTPAWFDWLAQHTIFYLDSPMHALLSRHAVKLIQDIADTLRRSRRCEMNFLNRLVQVTQSHRGFLASRATPPHTPPPLLTQIIIDSILAIRDNPPHNLGRIP